MEAYVRGLLTRCGSDGGDDGGNTVDDWAGNAPVLAGLAAASVQGRVALGARAGARVRRQVTPWPPRPNLLDSGRATRATMASISMLDSVCLRINEID